MNNLNPQEIINKIQKEKYKKLVWPILLVVLSFIINNVFQIHQTKYAALIGLLWYLLIFMQFKVNKSVPEAEEHSVSSPITGKIIEKSEVQIVIEKSCFDTIDVRCVNNENLEITWQKQPIFFNKNCDMPNQLIGFSTGKNRCKIKFGSEWMCDSELGRKILAGDSILIKRIEHE